MAYIGKEPIVGNFQKCDALTASATADYTLQVSSTNVSPESANHMLVSLNGVIQQPGATGGFTVSGSTLSFTSALTSSDTIDFVILLGNVLDIGTPSDDTVTLAKMASGTDGNIISYDTSGNPVAVATGTDGQVLTSSGAGAVCAFEDAAGGNTPMILVHPSSGQAISSATNTKVTLDTEIIDTDSTFASDKWTPAVAGKYYISGNTSINMTSAGAYLQANIYKNGSMIAAGQVQTEGTTATIMAYVEVIDTADADDYYELYVRQNTGGSLSTNGGSDLYTKMMGFRIG